MSEELFYIRNTQFVGNCILFWRTDGKGYTCNIDEAWKVNKKKAMEICHSRPNEDIPIPALEVEASAVRHLTKVIKVKPGWGK